MQKFFLLLKEIFSSKFISLLVFFVILLSVFLSSVLIIVGFNINYYISDKFASSVPPDLIKITPKPLPGLAGLFGFAAKRPAGTLLDEKSLHKIESMKGVKTVFPLMASQIPMQAVISIFGLNYKTDLICIGAPYSFVSQDIKELKMKDLWRSWEKGMELPSLIPNVLFDAYNNSMAEPNGLPRITEDMAIGRKFQITFGKSSIKTMNTIEVENSTVIGFTGKIANICLVIPLQAVQYYNRLLKEDKREDGYMTAFVQAKDHASHLELQQEIKKMNFIVEAEKSLSQEIISLKNNLNLAVRIITIIIIFLTTISVSFSIVIAALDRIEYYGILRVLGASRLFIAISLWTKYVIIGFTASCLGLYFFSYLSNQIPSFIKIAGFKIITTLPEDLKLTILSAGIILPFISAIPAILKISFKEMSGD